MIHPLAATARRESPSEELSDSCTRQWGSFRYGINHPLELRSPTRWTPRKPKMPTGEISLRVAERSERVYFLTGAETRGGTLGIRVSEAR